jgi:hypothetical protein
MHARTRAAVISVRWYQVYRTVGRGRLKTGTLAGCQSTPNFHLWRLLRDMASACWARQSQSNDEEGFSETINNFAAATRANPVWRCRGATLHRVKRRTAWKAGILLTDLHSRSCQDHCLRLKWLKFLANCCHYSDFCTSILPNIPKVW